MVQALTGSGPLHPARVVRMTRSLVGRQGSGSVLTAFITLSLVTAACGGPSITDTPTTPMPYVTREEPVAPSLDIGLLLAVLVLPVLLVALGWLAYIFRIIFREPPTDDPSGG